jgi:hypothetical protein
MPNITIHLDEDTHRRAKIYAATHRVSISDLFREHIRSLTGRDIPDALGSYSRGELSAHDAMDALGITCIEDLYSRTRSAGHELPRRLGPEAQREAARVTKLIAPVKRRA